MFQRHDKIRHCKTVFFFEVFHQMVKSAEIVDLREKEKHFNSFLMLAPRGVHSSQLSLSEVHLIPWPNQTLGLEIMSRCWSEACAESHSGKPLLCSINAVKQIYSEMRTNKYVSISHCRNS